MVEERTDLPELEASTSSSASGSADGGKVAIRTAEAAVDAAKKELELARRRLRDATAELKRVKQAHRKPRASRALPLFRSRGRFIANSNVAGAWAPGVKFRGFDVYEACSNAEHDMQNTLQAAGTRPRQQVYLAYDATDEGFISAWELEDEDLAVLTFTVAGENDYTIREDVRRVPVTLHGLGGLYEELHTRAASAGKPLVDLYIDRDANSV